MPLHVKKIYTEKIRVFKDKLDQDKILVSLGKYLKTKTNFKIAEFKDFLLQQCCEGDQWAIKNFTKKDPLSDDYENFHKLNQAMLDKVAKLVKQIGSNGLIHYEKHAGADKIKECHLNVPRLAEYKDYFADLIAFLSQKNTTAPKVEEQNISQVETHRDTATEHKKRHIDQNESDVDTKRQKSESDEELSKLLNKPDEKLRKKAEEILHKNAVIATRTGPVQATWSAQGVAEYDAGGIDSEPNFKDALPHIQYLISASVIGQTEIGKRVSISRASFCNAVNGKKSEKFYKNKFNDTMFQFFNSMKDDLDDVALKHLDELAVYRMNQQNMSFEINKTIVTTSHGEETSLPYVSPVEQSARNLVLPKSSLKSPIPYPGAKGTRVCHNNLIKPCWPRDAEGKPIVMDMVIDPFGGSGQMLLILADLGFATKFVLNDIDIRLVKLYQQIASHPKELFQRVKEKYHLLYSKLEEIDESYYENGHVSKIKSMFAEIITLCREQQKQHPKATNKDIKSFLKYLLKKADDSYLTKLCALLKAYLQPILATIASKYNLPDYQLNEKNNIEKYYLSIAKSMLLDISKYLDEENLESVYKIEMDLAFNKLIFRHLLNKLYIVKSNDEYDDELIAIYYAILLTGFGNKVFPSASLSTRAVDVDHALELLYEKIMMAYKTFNKVTFIFSNLDYADVVNNYYQSQKTIVFMDPPYFGIEKLYEHTIEENKFMENLSNWKNKKYNMIITVGSCLNNSHAVSSSFKTTFTYNTNYKTGSLTAKKELLTYVYVDIDVENCTQEKEMQIEDSQKSQDGKMDCDTPDATKSNSELGIYSLFSQQSMQREIESHDSLIFRP